MMWGGRRGEEGKEREGREGLRVSSGHAALSCCIPGEHGRQHALLTTLGCTAPLGLGQRQDQTPGFGKEVEGWGPGPPGTGPTIFEPRSRGRGQRVASF